VRIDEVGRTMAVAEPIGGPAVPVAVESDDVQSAPRRRGRRGGRRRSPEKEPAGDEA
jgi:hypothetical protein